MQFIRKYSLYLIICILIIYTIVPLMQPGFFTMHDDEQVGRLYELDYGLKAGHIPVRITQHLGFGYGYSLFNFYPPLVYYVAEIFVLGGVGFISAIKLMIGLGFVLSAVFMFLFSKEYLGKFGAIVASIAYVYLPYHAVDVYVRGALPEFWSFVFLPALFWAYYKLAQTQKGIFSLLSGIFFGLLILTHNLIAMMSGIFVGIYILFLTFSIQQKKQFLFKIIISGIVGLSLSASFWIPSFFERTQTMISLLTTELADYNQHFVYIRQLWNSPWGYGGSLYGLNDGLSFQIGKIHLIGICIASVIGFCLWIKKNKSAKIIFLFIFLFLIATFMMTFYSKPIWDSLDFFSYIQFPWRFLLFSGFFSSFLLGAVFLFINSNKLKFLLATLMIVIIIIFYKDNFTPEKYLRKAIDQNYINYDVIKWRTSLMAFEYVPKGVATKISVNNTTIIDIEKSDIANTSYKVIKGNLHVFEEINKPQYKKYTISGTGGLLRINTFSYPGWKIYIDAKETYFSNNNKFKLIDIKIAPGNHIIEAIFTDTWPRVIGNIISAASFMGIIFYIIGFSSWRNYKKIHEKRKNTNHS